MTGKDGTTPCPNPEEHLAYGPLDAWSHSPLATMSPCYGNSRNCNEPKELDTRRSSFSAEEIPLTLDGEWICELESIRYAVNHPAHVVTWEFVTVPLARIPFEQLYRDFDIAIDVVGDHERIPLVVEP